MSERTKKTQLNKKARKALEFYLINRYIQIQISKNFPNMEKL